MTTIVTRAGKGSPLTNTEVDTNFTNLNSAKIETLTSTDGSVTVTGTGSARDLSVPVNPNVVSGPASATDNAVARFDTTTGKLIQNSVVTIDDTGNEAGLLSQQFSDGTAVTVAAGKQWYNGTTGSWNLGMGGGNITQQVGEELFRYGKASTAIDDTNLQAVYKTGTVGGSSVVTFAPTIAGITDADSIFGIATEPIALNGFGRITTYGLVRGINTTGSAYGETWADGDDIWYNPVTGGLTKTKPSAPNIKLMLGTVIFAGTGGSGSFIVRIGSSSTLGGTDSNVQFSSLANLNLLQYDSTAQYWKNVAPSSVVNVGSAAKWSTARTLSFTGDATGSGSVDGSANVATALTLANTAVTAGSYTNTSLTVDAKGRITAASSGTAPVTSVGATAPIASSGGTTPAISLASAYGDTQNPYGSKTANYFLAAPNGTAGSPSFRAIVAADIPTLNQNTTGTASNVTGTVAIANGGTGATTASAALTNLGAYPSSNPSGYTSNTGTVTSVSGTGSVSGLTLSGTVTSSGSLTLGGAFSTTITGVSDAYRWWNNFGDNHSTRTSFDAQGAASTVNFGWRYVQGTTNGPGIPSASQYYSQFVGLGNDYPYTQYGMQLAIPRTPLGGSPYLSVRFEESGSFGAWSKIYAGYADTAGNGGVTSVNGQTGAVTLATGGFDAGTVMLFRQTAAPTGWTKDVTNFNDSAIRVVTGTVASGGTVAFTTAFASQTPSGSVSVNTSGLSAGATTLSTTQMPSHSHNMYTDNGGGGSVVAQGYYGGAFTRSGIVLATGGGGSHSHSISGSASASFSGTAINLAVKYCDVIFATKD